MEDTIPDVLAHRYATSAMKAVWSPVGKIILQRKLWVASMKAQQELGMPLTEATVAAYETALESVDLDSIAAREKRFRHDVTANVHEFNERAGGLQAAHEGFTSRDATDNVEQLQILHAMLLIRDRAVAVLARLQERAREYATLAICGRSHNVPAQVTTLGKRFATMAEEMLIAFEQLEHCIAGYPLRGIKGPMGTQQDMVDLLGSPEKTLHFEDIIRRHLGFENVLTSVGQIYPRSLDFLVISTLVGLASAPGNMATTIRLMAGNELAHEGFGVEQMGSSAMPHKMNSRTCERINGLLVVLGGFLEMVKGLVGNQWFEGDVSCSVVRRVALPGAFFAVDGLFEATLTVLDEMQVFRELIGQELRRYLPFLNTTRLRLAAVEAGLGSQAAHALIRTHAIAAIGALRQGEANSFALRLAFDDAFPLGLAEIERIAAITDHGLALEHTERVCEKIDAVILRYPEAALYHPKEIL